jgi:hypothetical protein
MKNKLTFFLFLFFFHFFQYSKAQQSAVWYQENGRTEFSIKNTVVSSTLNPQDSSVIQSVFMNKESPILLSEVIITPEVPELIVKGDTLEYNPRAFQMAEGSVVEDLLKRLPGVEVNANGKITVVGKEIKRVFVDGKEFFGQDPKMATKNVTVNMLNKVQVIDKKSDQNLLTGVEDGKEETVINLVIKPDMKKGWLSNLSAGLGSFVNNQEKENVRYNGNVFVGRFQNNNQYALLANANNINNQSFTDEGSTGKNQENGIIASTNAGINIVSIMNDKWKMGGNVRHNCSEELIKQHSFRENLLKDSVSYGESYFNGQSYSSNFAFDHKIEFTPNVLNTFVLSTMVTYNSSDFANYSTQKISAGDEDSTQVNYSDTQTKTHSGNLLFDVELTYSQKFSKKGRRFNLTGKFSTNRNKGNGVNTSINEFYIIPSKNQYLNQESNHFSNNNFHSFTVSYIEPIRKINNTLQLSYNIHYNYAENIRRTFDYDLITNTYSKLNPEYSKSLWNHFVNQTIGLSYNVIQPKYFYNIGFNIIPSYTQSTSYVKNGDSFGNDSILNKIVGRRIVNYSPQLNFAYHFSKHSNLRFIYRGNTNQPDISLLDPTPNNYNPLLISIGNLDLLPSFLHNLSFRYNYNELQTQRSLTGSLYFSFIQNEIINITSYEEATAIQYIMPINENGSWNMSGDILYSNSLGTKKKIKFSIQTKITNNNKIGFIRLNQQNERNISKTLGVSGNIGLSYNNDWFYGQFRGNVRYLNTSNTLKRKTNQQTNYELIYNAQLYLPCNWTLVSEINCRVMKGLSIGYNKKEIAWNAEITKQFFNKKNATLRIKWFDILQQKLNINRNITSQYIEDVEYNTLSSYFLVSLAFRFNQSGNKKNR